MKPERFFEMTNDELNNTVNELKKELFELRFKQAVAQLPNPLRIRECKKDIARAMTVLRQREIGISIEPTSTSKSKSSKKAKTSKVVAKDTKPEAKVAEKEVAKPVAKANVVKKTTAKKTPEEKAAVKTTVKKAEPKDTVKKTTETKPTVKKTETEAVAKVEKANKK